MRVVYTVPGQPVSKGRPRFGKGQVFTPLATRRAEANSKRLAASARPAGWQSDARYQILVRGFYGDRRRRDIDNLVKLHMDACNGVLWDDDCQVDRLIVERHYDKAQPRTEVEVTPLA